ncbi:MAG: AraC family transcriptional regulator ligand-binding domain-containing protein [Pseudomonadota bacterium]
MAATTQQHPAHTPDFRFSYSGYVQGIAQVLGLKENDLPDYLAGTGLSQEALYPGSTTHVGVAEFIRIIQNGQRIIRDPTVGLRCGKNLRNSIHGPVGVLSVNAPDLFNALMTPAEFAPLRLPIAETQVSFDEDWLICELSIRAEIPADNERIILEAFAVTLQNIIETYIGGTLESGRFEFAYSQPDYADQYADYFHVPVMFAQPKTVLRLPAELARQTKPDQDPAAYAAAYQLCTDLMNRMPDTALQIPDRIRRLLLSNSIGELTEEDVARALYISRRTMARRLDALGLSYRRIRQQLLMELSARYLTEDHLSVEATANLLGYHDTANFRRAFKRWYQVTPAEFRQRISGQNPGAT